MKRTILLYTAAFLSAAPLHALTWNKSRLNTAIESGRSCSVAIDNAGRVHTLWIEGGLSVGTRLVLVPPTLTAGVVMRYPQVRISSAYQAANPKMFFRHTVQRDR